MNRKQLIMLLVALAVIGGASLMLLNHRQQSWTAAETQIGQKLFNNFQMNDVADIHIKSDGDLDLKKMAAGVWCNAAVIRPIFPKSASC